MPTSCSSATRASGAFIVLTCVEAHLPDLSRRRLVGMRESDSLVPPVPDVRGSGLSSHRKPMMMRVFIATVVIGASSLLVYALPNLVLVTSPYPAARFATPLDGAMHHVVRRYVPATYLCYRTVVRGRSL